MRAEQSSIARSTGAVDAVGLSLADERTGPPLEQASGQRRVCHMVLGPLSRAAAAPPALLRPIGGARGPRAGGTPPAHARQTPPTFSPGATRTWDASNLPSEGTPARGLAFWDRLTQPHAREVPS